MDIASCRSRLLDSRIQRRTERRHDRLAGRCNLFRIGRSCGGLVCRSLSKCRGRRRDRLDAGSRDLRRQPPASARWTPDVVPIHGSRTIHRGVATCLARSSKVWRSRPEPTSSFCKGRRESIRSRQSVWPGECRKALSLPSCFQMCSGHRSKRRAFWNARHLALPFAPASVRVYMATSQPEPSVMLPRRAGLRPIQGGVPLISRITLAGWKYAQRVNRPTSSLNQARYRRSLPMRPKTRRAAHRLTKRRVLTSW